MPEGLKKDPQLPGGCLYLHRAKEARLGRLAVAVVDQVAHANPQAIFWPGLTATIADCPRLVKL